MKLLVLILEQAIYLISHLGSRYKIIACSSELILLIYSACGGVNAIALAAAAGWDDCLFGPILTTPPQLIEDGRS